MVDALAGRIIAVDGASGAGKTTAVEAVARTTGWTLLPEGYRRLVPPPSLEFSSPRELVILETRLLREEARRYSEARAWARGGGTVIADTGFLGPLTYADGLVSLGAAPRTVLAPLVAFARRLEARGSWGVADVYLYLETPVSVRTARIRRDPVGHPVELVRRHREVGNFERRFYRERFARLFGPRFRAVSGAGSRTVVARRVARAARGGPVLPPPEGLAQAVLALFRVSDPSARPARGNR
jgi:hypothetical protein